MPGVNKGTRSQSQTPYATLQQKLKGTKSTIHRFAVSPDSLSVAAGTIDGEVRTWNIVDGASVLLNKHDEQQHVVQSIAFSPDGRYIAASMAETVWVWILKTGQPKYQFTHQEPIHITAIAFSPGGEYLACANMDIHIWKIDTKQLVHVLRGHEEEVHGLSYFSDGLRLSSSAWDGTLRLWKLDSTVQLHDTWHAYGSEEIGDSTLSPDGTILASGGDDRALVLWEVETGNWLTSPYKGHPDIVSCVSFSPDGKHVASASALRAVGEVHIVEAKTGCFVAKVEGGYGRVAYTPDGRYILTLDREEMSSICVLQLTTPAPPAPVEHNPSGSSLSHSATDAAAPVNAETNASVQETEYKPSQSQYNALQRQLDEMKSQISTLTGSLAHLEAQGL